MTHSAILTDISPPWEGKPYSIKRHGVTVTNCDSEPVQTPLEKDKKQLHPVYHPKSHANALVIERGEGVWLYTADGKKILDGMAGLWNVNAGYGREELAKAAYDQMKDLAFTSNFAGMTNLPSIQLTDKLATFAYPGLNTTFFTSGGSESNDSAFKTARYYWKRKGKPTKYKVIARKGSYHGVTLATTLRPGSKNIKRCSVPQWRDSFTSPRRIRIALKGR